MLISVNKLNSSSQILTEVSVGYQNNLKKINPNYISSIDNVTSNHLSFSIK
jgi:hypothetical protein